MKKAVIHYRVLLLISGVILFLLGARVMSWGFDSDRAMNECERDYVDHDRQQACLKVKVMDFLDEQSAKATILYASGLLLAGTGGYGYFLKRKKR